MRPYRNAIVFDHDNSVNMVRHNYERIQPYIRPDVGGTAPFTSDDQPQRGQPHSSIGDFP
jgi:hypothetical protein